MLQVIVSVLVELSVLDILVALFVDTICCVDTEEEDVSLHREEGALYLQREDVVLEEEGMWLAVVGVFIVRDDVVVVASLVVLLRRGNERCDVVVEIDVFC